MRFCPKHAGAKMRSLSLAAAVVLMSAAVAVSQHSVDKGG